MLESRYGFSGSALLDRFLAITAMQIEPVTVEQSSIARLAFRSFGKGRRPAAHNFGDCFSYALATAVDEPLLFQGNDFAQTDVKRVSQV